MDTLKSPHIQIALASGICIVVMAYFSKHILPKEIGYLFLAIPPFIATIYEALLNKYKNTKLCTTNYWIVAVLGATGLVILLHSF